MSGACLGYEGYAALSRLVVDRVGQAEAFDDIGSRYEYAYPHKKGQLSAGQWLSHTLPAGSRVLDVGCGTGFPTARQLVDAGLEVVGVDLSATMVARARENVPEAEFHQLDLADLRDGRLGHFDAVAAFFSLLMLPRTEIPHALRMLHGHLRPGGLLALALVEADVDDVPIPFLGNSIRVSGYLWDDLRHVVSDAGFEIVGEESHVYAPSSTELPPEIQLYLHLRRA
ncbi:class I SAM-dependent methyltransferase [Streptomyces sp. NPDC059740]|uniref:class I SAM-dependent methyltransferase n=1 Tax=Streptomyces sp. NPDC059740 TaxID=3346926 RepID=UPI00364678CA